MNRRFDWFARGVLLALVLLSFGLVSRAAAAQGAGTLVVTVEDDTGTPLTGSQVCVRVHVDAGGAPGQVVAGLCDGRDDGAADGMLSFQLGAGDYIAIASFVPVGYQSGAQVHVSVSAGQTTPLTIQVEPGGRIVFVRSVNADGVPVGNPCVEIYENAGGGQLGRVITGGCAAPQGDPGNGVIYFQGIPPGQYVVVETRPPAGLQQGSNTSFTVPAGGGDAIYVTVSHQGGTPSLVEQLVALLIQILRQLLNG